MYAIVKTGGKQLKVEKGTEAVVEKLDSEVGDQVKLDVLFVSDGKEVVVGSDAMASATVTVEVVEHFKGEKVTVFKFKRRKGYKRLKGHRQLQTRIKVTDIEMVEVPKKKAAEKAAKEAVAEKPKAEPKKEAKPKAEKPKAEPKKAEKPKAAPKKEETAAEPAQCEAIKGNGDRCTNKAKDGSKYCGVHAKYEG